MGRARLIIERGDTLERTVIWQNPDESPIDLTSFAVTCTLVVGDVTYDLTEDDGLTVDDDDGTIGIELTVAQTAEFTEQYGKWKLYVLSNYVGTTLAEGLVFVSFFS